MNPEVKKAWIAALRSGNYEQGHEMLARVPDEDATDERTEHCCLGVLADLAVQGGVIEDFDGNKSFPDIKVMNWAGLPDTEAIDEDENGNILWNAPQKLWRMNDGADGFEYHTFSEIAEWIEFHL
jgi:hypothetical protein